MTEDPQGEPVLEGRGLSRVVDGETLFADVDFDVSRGLLWVRGPSGAGKTELLRRVAGLVPGEGTVRLGGVDAAELGWPVYRTRVTLVPQRVPRLPGTGRDALQRIAGLKAQRDREGDDPVELAERWGLRADRWDVPMDRLSGGEAQRLWLALALARRPDVVLLDEPTSALDAGAREQVEADLAARTGLLVTHDEALGERLSRAVLEPFS